MTIDLGTGDGAAVLAAARRDPSTLAIGIDADAASIATASRHASRPVRKGGLLNALFLNAAAETLPLELAGVAAEVTVQLPWGSLLRGCVGFDARIPAGIAALLRPAGQVILLLAPATRDLLPGVPTEAPALARAVDRAFGPFGLRVIEWRPAGPDDRSASHSSWERRLTARGSARAVIRITLGR